MTALGIVLNWIHILCAALFLGTMFVGTFVLLPVLKAHLEYEQRQKFVVHFIPRVRRIMRVVIALLVVSGVAQAVRLRFVLEGAASVEAITLFGLHVAFAAVPVAVFALAPRILGAKSKEGLCCDPDADDPPVFMGVMSSTGAALHYVAISGGWIAVLCAIVLGHMR